MSLKMFGILVANPAEKKVGFSLESIGARAGGVFS